MTTTDMENPAAIWAAVLVDEMVRAGVTAVVIAPGSRSTPLVLAFAAQERIRVYSLLDERGAAFFALGIALETGRPAAVLCTSGTAAANFFPAVIEASQSHVPLVVLTADRPAELRNTGANQTIDQVGLYGAYVRHAQDLLPPVVPAPALLLRYLRTSVDRALAAAQAPVPGPVHLNFPFRKPLEPASGQMPVIPEPGREGAFTHIEPARPRVVFPEIDWPARGLIVAGPRCPDGDFPPEVFALSNKFGYPVVADALSGLRFGTWTRDAALLNPQIGRAFRNGDLPLPDLVLQFGAVPTSNSLVEFLSALPEGTLRISVQPHGTWHDDTHLLSHLVHADPAEFCRELVEKAPAVEPDRAWIHRIREAEAGYWRAVDAAARSAGFEGQILRDVVENLPEDSRLFVSNSLAVRHLDEFVRPEEKRIRVFCNRGASGIDGTISTALGLAASTDRPVALVLGDLAFYHDLNGLLALRRCGVRATIVILHNDGGGIFRRLPVAGFAPPFEDLFLTPHGLDFEPAARMFGAEFCRPVGRQAFREAYSSAVASSEPNVIEVRTDSAVHEKLRREILNSWPEKPRPASGKNQASGVRS